MLIDAHVHIFPPEFIARRQQLAEEEPDFALLYANEQSPMRDGGQLLRDMRGVDRAWVVGFNWRLQKNAVCHNDYLLRMAQAHPGKLRCLAGFHPSAPWAAAEASRALQNGMHGLGELAFYHSDLNLDELAPLCNLCATHNAPLMLHINEPIGTHYAGKAPMGLTLTYQLVKQHPGCKFVLSHLGGGIFFYQTLKAREVALALQNVWLDTAASPFVYQPLALKLAVQLMGREKILLASDYPLLGWERTRQLLLQAELGPQELDMVCGLNAAQLIT